MQMHHRAHVRHRRPGTVQMMIDGQKVAAGQLVGPFHPQRLARVHLEGRPGKRPLIPPQPRRRQIAVQAGLHRPHGHAEGWSHPACLALRQFRRRRAPPGRTRPHRRRQRIHKGRQRARAQRRVRRRNLLHRPRRHRAPHRLPQKFPALHDSIPATVATCDCSAGSLAGSFGCGLPPRQTEQARLPALRSRAQAGQIFRLAAHSLTSSSPVSSFKYSRPIRAGRRKSNIPAMEFVTASNDPCPMRSPCSQLSSTKRMMEVCAVSVWSTKLTRAQGEITSMGRRGP